MIESYAIYSEVKFYIHIYIQIYDIVIVSVNYFPYQKCNLRVKYSVCTSWTSSRADHWRYSSHVIHKKSKKYFKL